MNEIEAALLLLEIPGMWSSRLKKLCDYAGSFQEALTVKGKSLLKDGIIKSGEHAEMFDKAVREKLDAVQDNYSRESRLKEKNIKLSLYYEESYPKRLLQLFEPPGVIFYKGGLPDENKPLAAIIGARNCSEYGRSVTEFFASKLSEAGVYVISGMAYGIDSAAARGALKVNGKSYAVLGCGADICYPMESFDIYTKMAQGTGGIISEYPPGAKPLGYRFVERNRLIACLCDVLLVMEAKEKSGTAITVSNALDLGRDIFALPGRITDPLGRGCNTLIRDGAIPLVNPEDVLNCLGINMEQKSVMKEKDLSELSASETEVYNVLEENSRHIEDISEMCRIPVKTAISILFKLEMKGYAVSTSPAYYRKAFDSD